MIWLVIDETKSETIVSCNTFFNKETETYELWITKINGKTMKVKETQDSEEIFLTKEAIDYAIENGELAFRL